jgi:hypothetical protein
MHEALLEALFIHMDETYVQVLKSDRVCAALGLLHFGCLQHLRAYFKKAQKVSELPSSRSLARVAVEDYIGKVYAVEREIKKLEEEHECRG